MADGLDETILHLTWTDFQFAVWSMADKVDRTRTHIYGVPRGGLCLAVALSHETGIPLAMEPGPNMIVVDDIADSGKTIAEFEEAQRLVWVARHPARHVAQHVRLLPAGDDRWVLFPWEKEENAVTDRAGYAPYQRNL